MFFLEYLFVFHYFLIVFFFSCLLCSVSYFFDAFLFSKNYRDFEKVSSYECGFQPFSDARGAFDIRFYLVAILFIVFDLEITYLIPWVVFFQKLGDMSFWTMIFFLLILTFGFMYEWVKGALDWQ